MNVRLEWQYKKKEATFGLCRPAEASIDKFVVRCPCVERVERVDLAELRPTTYEPQTIFSCADFFLAVSSACEWQSCVFSVSYRKA